MWDFEADFHIFDNLHYQFHRRRKKWVTDNRSNVNESDHLSFQKIGSTKPQNESTEKIRSWKYMK